MGTVTDAVPPGALPPGAEIHAEHPFATPAGDRDPVRRFRGRLVAPVTLWTTTDGVRRAGLTVASTVVAGGAPARLLGLLDPESELYEALEAADEQATFTVQPLDASHRQLADQFAGLMPAPGGVFRQWRWRDTEWGPVLADLPTWAGCRVQGIRQVGWSMLVEATVEHAEVGADAPSLVYRRGRYRVLDPD